MELNETRKNPYAKFIDTKKLYRLPGAAFVVAGAIYLLWLIFHLNSSVYLLSFLFFTAQLYIYLSFSLSIRNHWNATYSVNRPKLTKKPGVAIVITTCNEPTKIVEKTVRSILNVSYDGEVIILVSNDGRGKYEQKIEKMMARLSVYWDTSGHRRAKGAKRELHLLHTSPHGEAKAGNLNQAVAFFRKYYPHIDFLLTQDADEVVSPDILNATMGYFMSPNTAYVQTIKQVRVSPEDPFGNGDRLWYSRTAPARDYDNAMFACGSGVVWRISSLESIGGFSTWNLVEDLTTSYNLLAQKWQGKYHYEALSKGLAPEDLPNYIKQRGTWALDTIRLFFWDNPLFKKGLSLSQKLQFLELPLFYFNGIFLILLIVTTAISLFGGIWPTTASASEHALFLAPGFLCMEVYYLMLAGSISLKRTRQLQIGLSPIFAHAAIKALLFGPTKKPKYKVTMKNNIYGNYLVLVIPQLIIVLLLAFGVIKSISGTPLYSKFDWAIVFWSFYQSTFYMQIIKVSWWKWRPEFSLALPQFQLPLRAQTKVGISYSPDTL